eukprot:TRINITY_DN19970_c0_g1_i2.p1 TRINITY_DN19970_c0_g1~~TRINITY_DN19970_c0_g1_i2.p1  ORF type:complete len:571 (-),score=152.32 TRINITY_DN19970_c0_g1_i2:66-1778(-)
MCIRDRSTGLQVMEWARRSRAQSRTRLGSWFKLAILLLFLSAAAVLIYVGLAGIQGASEPSTRTPEALIRRADAIKHPQPTVAIASTAAPTKDSRALELILMATQRPKAPVDAEGHHLSLDATFRAAVAAADDELDQAQTEGFPENMAHRSAWLRMVESLDGYEPPYSGTGVVICGGGPVYFSSALVAALLLRKLGSNLPIEIWHSAGEAPSEPMQRAVAGFEIKFMDGTEGVSAAGKMGERHQGKKFPLKSIALVYSRFEHVLFLDADNFVGEAPDQLFKCKSYKETGAVFWPDFMPLEDNGIWEVMGLKYSPGIAQESGQLLINKGVHWRALMLAAYMNLRHEFYYQLVVGDKDTFQFAWRALSSHFHMVEHPTGSAGSYDSHGFGGHTMVQHHPQGGRPIFFHRNLAKFPSGLKPKKSLRGRDRTWTQIVECVPADPQDLGACVSLHSWTGGLIRWSPENDRAKRTEDAFVKAAGIDLERSVLSLFRQLAKLPEYQEYAKQLLGEGPRGTYRQTCRGCHTVHAEDGADEFGCECEGLSLIHISEPTRLLSISYAVFCLKKKKKKIKK